jgi:hypothetical protein
MKVTLSEAIKQAINYALKNVHTILPGKIVEYDYTAQKASVLPTIKEKFYTGKVLSMPIIANVPVIFPRTANASITFPLEKDDKVLLLFSEKSLERWLSKGDEVEAGVNRRFDLTDCIAIPGLYSFADSSPSNGEDLIIKYNNSKIIIKKNGGFTIENDSDNLLEILSDTMQAISQITVGGTPIDNPTVFTTLKGRIDSMR